MMKWSTDKPQVPGWYWFRIAPGHYPFIERYDMGKTGLVVWGEGGTIYQIPAGEWSGPILPPTDAPAQDYYEASEVEALLLDLVWKWEAQTGAREGVTFRITMKSIRALLDQLRKGRG